MGLLGEFCDQVTYAFALVFLKAMRYAKPVVTSVITGVGWLVEHGVTDFFSDQDMPVI